MQNQHEWAQFIQLVFSQHVRAFDAIFVHAWDDLRERIIAHTAELFRSSGARWVILNSLPEFEVEKPGFSEWKEALVKEGIPESSILGIEPAPQTHREALALANVVKSHAIASLAIVSVPMHIPRAFLTDLYVIRQSGIPCSLIPSTITDISWTEEIRINPMTGGVETTTRLARFAAEISRIETYRAETEKGNPDFGIASVQEGIDHLKKLL